MDKKTLIFLGPQGCGKGTQIARIKEHLQKTDSSHGIVHFEMGKTLRERAEKPDYTGTLTDEILKGGGLIPYAISASLFALYLMDNIHHGDEHLFIDGFPRTKEQVPALDSAMEFYRREHVDVVCITISDEEAVKRLLARGRSDDTEESIRKRLAWSREQTMPNIEWFRRNPRYRVIDIFGERPIEEVSADIFKALDI